MRELMLISELTPEMRERLQGFAPDQAQKESICEKILESLTYDATAELFHEIIRTMPYNDASNLDRFLWATRAAYVCGYKKAIDAYSEAFETGLRGISE